MFSTTTFLYFFFVSFHRFDETKKDSGTRFSTILIDLQQFQICISIEIICRRFFSSPLSYRMLFVNNSESKSINATLVHWIYPLALNVVQCSDWALLLPKSNLALLNRMTCSVFTILFRFPFYISIRSSS